MAEEFPFVSIVIPHYKGDMILRCLDSLYNDGFDRKEIIVIDDGSVDGSIESARSRFPDVRYIRNPANLGFVRSCNRGIGVSSGKYIVLLNDDTEVSPGWLECLISFAESRDNLGACQPKILSLRDPGKFDYSGAAGGLIDVFGHPFALGRVFYTVERDEGQYDVPRRIFWASGAAMLISRKALDETGLLDECFTAHMEEIDLCWRMQLLGFEVWSVPEAVIHHLSGGTLPARSWKKEFLNHRNNLMMIFKNYSTRNLLWIFPIRICFEIISSIVFWTIVPLCAIGSFITCLPELIRKRRNVQARRKTGDRDIMNLMFKGSIALKYFLCGKRETGEILEQGRG